MLLCELYVLIVIRKRRKKKLTSWHNHRFLCRIGGINKNVLVRKKKNTWGGGQKDLFLYKGNFIPGLCTLFPFPLLFHFFCGLSYMLWKKEAYLTRQAAILQLEIFCLFVSSQRWEESSASAPFGNCRLYFAIFQPVGIGWECLLSLFISFLLSIF